MPVIVTVSGIPCQKVLQELTETLRQRNDQKDDIESQNWRQTLTGTTLHADLLPMMTTVPDLRARI